MATRVMVEGAVLEALRPHLAAATEQALQQEALKPYRVNGLLGRAARQARVGLYAQAPAVYCRRCGLVLAQDGTCGCGATDPALLVPFNAFPGAAKEAAREAEEEAAKLPTPSVVDMYPVARYRLRVVINARAEDGVARRGLHPLDAMMLRAAGEYPAPELA
ncbi:hypothetical protein [Desulfovirgula thermocuniculi]|uniref:hypothetical protein n=1 Tax=Desulfovirgula thermocuniculi TaxID=348842 RepID=UPI0012EBC35B|nr:hypothetical protein [Desulfovirgula thermocuniculi]